MFFHILQTRRKKATLNCSKNPIKLFFQIPNVAFFVTTGDNFYYRGVQNVDDFRFYATFERVYNDRSLQRNWYVIAGNHDYYGNVSAQILYTRKSKRWIFPDFYHTKGSSSKLLSLYTLLYEAKLVQ